MGICSTPILDDELCECCNQYIRGEHPEHLNLCTDCASVEVHFPDDYD